MNTKFYLNTTSKTVILSNTIINNTEFIELTPNTSDASKEKHIPDIKINDDILTVTIGSITHPMDENHYISFIYLETENGGQIKYLKPNDKPEVIFCIKNEKPITVYEYCTLHGLWKTDI